MTKYIPVCRGCIISGYPHLENCPHASYGKYQPTVVDIIDVEELVQKMANMYCPPHNAINDDPENLEGHYHCEECAEIIRLRFEIALREMAILCQKQNTQK